MNLFKRRRVNKYNKILNKRNKLIKNEVEQSNIRYNILTAIIYLFGVILIMQLFNLQVVNGSSYREISNTRLSREGKIEAARGRITDRTGVILSSTIDSFSLEMYKTNVDDEILNSSISLMIFFNELIWILFILLLYNSFLISPSLDNVKKTKGISLSSIV